MIEYLNVEVKPFQVDDGLKIISICTQINGEKYTLEEVCHLDDFTSHFDYIFDKAKHEIKEFLSEEK